MEAFDDRGGCVDFGIFRQRPGQPGIGQQDDPDLMAPLGEGGTDDLVIEPNEAATLPNDIRRNIAQAKPDLPCCRLSCHQQAKKRQQYRSSHQPTSVCTSTIGD